MAYQPNARCTGHCDGNTAIVTKQEARPVLVKLEKLSLPAQGGPFSGGFMSANDLALKFSNTPAEQLIGILPVLEVKEALRDEVEEDVLDEVWTEHNFEMEAMGEQVDETARLARKFELIAESFGTAIKLALTQQHQEAQATLIKVLEDYPGYGKEPAEAP